MRNVEIAKAYLDSLVFNYCKPQMFARRTTRVKRRNKIAKMSADSSET